MEDTIIDVNDIQGIHKLCENLCSRCLKAISQKKEIIFLCIGSDRATGDCLGPLIGEKLKFLNGKGVYSYGTLENPVHAKNLEQKISEINNTFKNPFIIAIDACLGSSKNVGKIYIENSALTPGAALRKSLPKVGSVSISAIVNVSGPLEFMTLQCTRLYVVMKLANVISTGIYGFVSKAFEKYQKADLMT